MSEQDPVRTTLDVPGEPGRTTLDPGAQAEPRSTTLDPVPGGPARTTLDPGMTAPASRVDHRLQPGMALDYELRERLGGGGEATVYRALDRRHDREVAIKIYHVVPHYAFEIGDEKHKQHFRREHTVDLYERREENGLHIEVMELCPLGTLETLAGGEPMSSEMLHEVVREVSEAIESMHPMYHGDVKPQNILVRSREPLDLVLTDFGLARDMEGRDRITSLGQGTHLYQPPEGASSSRLESDWWALGIIVAELAAGYHPFDGLPEDCRSRERLRDFLSTEEVPLDHLDDLGDKRIRNLAEGLLTRSLRRRWGYVQVKEWLAGGDPEVKRGTDHPKGRRVGFSFDGEIFHEEKPLGEAIRRSNNWAEIGQGVRLQELVAWVTGTNAAPLVERIAAGSPVMRAELTAALLATALVGDGRAVFRGIDLTSEAGLTRAAGQAALLAEFQQRNVLRHFGEITNNTVLTGLDHQWRTTLKETTDALPSAVPYAGKAEEICLVHSWQATFSQEAVAGLQPRVKRAVRNEPALREVSWFNDLFEKPATVGRGLALLASLPEAERQAAEIKARKAAEEEKKRREEEAAAEEKRRREAEEREAELQRRRQRRGPNLKALIMPFLGIAGLWQLWYALQLGNSFQEYLLGEPDFWRSGLTYLVALLVTLLGCAPAAGRAGFAPGAVSVLQFAFMILGVAGSPWMYTSWSGQSPLQAMGLTLLRNNPREWPAVAGLIATAGYVAVIMYTRRGSEPAPDDLKEKREMMVLTVVCPSLIVFAAAALFASWKGSWQVWLSTVAWWALVVAAMIILVWPALRVKGYRTGVPAAIMTLAAVLHAVGQWYYPVQNVFWAAQMVSCSVGFICPENTFGSYSPNGWFSPGGVFSPGGLAILALLLYVASLYIRWAFTRKKSDA